MKNYYDILGLQPDCSQEEIKQAYRKLSVKFHPDKNDGDGYFTEMFKQINEAHDVLSNPEKRRNYDSTMSNDSSQRKTNNGSQRYNSAEDTANGITILALYDEWQKCKAESDIAKIEYDKYSGWLAAACPK
jgi:curved DNA-binding protein CbpA